MKKITSVILAVLLCFSLALTAMAVGGARYIVDEGDRLTASELSELEGRAEVLYDRGGIGASCLIVDSLGVYTAPEYIDDVYADNCPASDAVVLLNEVESGSAYLYYIGDADSAVLGHEAELLGAYNNEDTYFDGIYEFIDTVAEIVLGDSDLESAALDAPASTAAAGNVSETLPGALDKDHPARLVDGEHLLGTEEADEISRMLDEISVRQNFDVVIVTVGSLGAKSAQAFADDYYDCNGYGMGADRDGVLLLISMEERDWYISTCGYGIEAITDAGRNTMSDYFVPYLSDGDYYTAFKTYAELCDKFVTQARTDVSYGIGNLDDLDYSIPLTAEDWITAVCVNIVIGIVAALIVCSILKGKLKTVAMQRGAYNYTVENSFEVTQSSDLFLYSTVSRTAKPKENESSGGGSSTHTSSSGTSHGGGGGKF